MGHELFKSKPESFPVKFIAGDVFDPAHLTVEHYGNYIEFLVSRPPPQLQAVHSLDDLHGRLSAIRESAHRIHRFGL